jgi:hypothetical protein
LPERLPLQIPAVTGRALGSVDSFAAFDGRVIVDIGEVLDGSRRDLRN